LAYLLQHANKVLTFEQILTHVWGKAYQDQIDYVHTYISHLRQKLEEDPKKPRYFLTQHGIGYRFHGPTASHLTPLKER
jgi:two-component system KDP operon response regulator KdpE